MSTHFFSQQNMLFYGINSWKREHGGKVDYYWYCNLTVFKRKVIFVYQIYYQPFWQFKIWVKTYLGFPTSSPQKVFYYISHWLRLTCIVIQDSCERRLAKTIITVMHHCSNSSGNPLWLYSILVGGGGGGRG